MPVDPIWRQLGDQLVHRRVQLDPEYRTRRAFVVATRAVGANGWYRMITSLELGERDNYKRETLAAAETAYRLQPGSIRAFIGRGAPLQCLDDAEADAPARPRQPPRYDDPVLQYLWETPDPSLSESQREALVQVYLALSGAASRGASAAPQPPASARTA
ncbi:hypothetical protein [Planotetraspora sp. GP83]|uniref:hypothetical protein n=1 Tax=Planotetraspora sp. GP83 TaxID=3156264 RepID=UPI003512B2FB